MNETMGKILIFVTGAAIGSAVTWKLVKTKYEQIAQAEIESVKEVYSAASRKAEEKEVPANNIVIDLDIPDEQGNKCAGAHLHYIPEEKIEKPKMSNEKPDIKEYAKLLKNEGYSIDYSGKSKKSSEEPVKEYPEDRPYSIKPEDYGEFTDYEEIELLYYADGYLADDMDCLVDDIDGTVGFDFADYIGEYEDDVAYIRNDKLKCDYCIDISLKKYKDVISDDYPIGVEEE